MKTKHDPKSCFALGACQGLKPACAGCEWHLAPGTVEGPFKRSRFTWLRRHQRAVVFVLCLVAALVAMGLVVGLGMVYLEVRHG